MTRDLANLRRLNPFYFRAGLLLNEPEAVAHVPVLIPFISGLDCYDHRPLQRRALRVLIPFISGLDCYAYAFEAIGRGPWS